MTLSAKMLDFYRNSKGHYCFNVAGEDFAQAIAALKVIPLHLRVWHEDKREWEIWPTEENETLLRRTFENGTLCLDSIKWQLGLF